MKHAVLIGTPPKSSSIKYIEAELTDNRKVYLAEAEYTPEELERFHAEAAIWILRRQGSSQFLADSDAGEDAIAYYRNYFDLVPERAVFYKRKPIGLYLYNNGLSYSGRIRSNYTIDDWGFPGSDPFTFRPDRTDLHVFLFAVPETHQWKDWSLLKREPGKEFQSYLDF